MVLSLNLLGAGLCEAAVVTRTATLDLEAALMSSVVPNILFTDYGLNPPVAVQPGDTLVLQVTFQNAQRLRIQAAPAPDPPPGIQDEWCSPNFYLDYPYPPPGAVTLETTFAGVTGSLFLNPSIEVDDCTGGDCWAYTPDLTNTSFDFNGVTLALTSQGFTGQVDHVVFTCAVPSGGAITVEGPIPVDPPQPVPSNSVPVEYSNDVDEAVAFSGTISLEMHGAPDPGQTLYTEPVDFPGNLLPADGLDFFPGVESGTELTQQVDALAYGTDAYLADLFTGEADLLFSVTGDGTADGREWALLREETSGTLSVAYVHHDLVSGDAPGGLDDLDAVELWGDPGVIDARYYSLQADATSGTSVFVDVGGSPVPFVSHADVLAAVTSLGYIGEPDQIDVDGMMVRNAGTIGRFDIGDVLLFSVRATPDGNFDGGEIIELRPGQPAKFFEHGGHMWDTSFDLTARLSILNGGADPAGSEDVDAVEATLASYLVGLIAGRVPDGSGPQPPLAVVREPSGDLTLSWSVSCSTTDTDYEIYAGVIGSYFSHLPLSCSTGGQTTFTTPVPAGDAYYLVVPSNGIYEGSYGSDSGGAERPPGIPSCRPFQYPQCGP